MMNLSAPRESRRGQSYNSPKYHIESRGVLNKKINKKYDRVHFNYLGRDVLLSTIYRALETNAKVYKLSGCAKTFHSTTMYMVNNWFVSFN